MEMNSTHDIFILTQEAITIYIYVVYTVILQIINTFGIVTNIINIVCFTEQGFDDSVNVSLLGLAVSDLGISVMMVLTCMGLTPAVTAASLPFDPIDLIYMTTAMIHLAFIRVSSCITAMITLERCLCITAPLKIKSIITPKRSAVAIICIFIICFWSGAPLYFVSRLDLKFSPLRNKTLLGMVSTSDQETVETISFIINNFSIPFCAFVIILVCTSILSLKLENQSKWRTMTTTSAQADKISSRNQKSARMVVMISVVFIVSFIPLSVNMLVMAFIPELAVNRKYFNISLIIVGLGHVMENINSSMNVCIYYHMSSNYRKNFQKLFCKRISKNGSKTSILKDPHTFSETTKCSQSVGEYTY